MFLAKHLVIMATMNDLSPTIPKIFISKDDLYNCLKSHKVWLRSVKPFLRYLAKTLRGAFNIAPPPPPSPNRVKQSFHSETRNNPECVQDVLSLIALRQPWNLPPSPPIALGRLRLYDLSLE